MSWERGQDWLDAVRADDPVRARQLREALLAGAAEAAARREAAAARRAAQARGDAVATSAALGSPDGPPDPATTTRPTSEPSAPGQRARRIIGQEFD
jgi:hypothetical protein